MVGAPVLGSMSGGCTVVLRVAVSVSTEDDIVGDAEVAVRRCILHLVMVLHLYILLDETRDEYPRHHRVHHPHFYSPHHHLCLWRGQLRRSQDAQGQGAQP